MEIWDAYDCKLQKIKDKQLRRGEQISDGVFHLVCDILVRHADDTYLLMQRDKDKSYGGMWEATAGGSALSGETPLACAKRELREETGICAQSLQQVGTVVNAQMHTIFVEFLCVTDCKKDCVTLQEGETSAYQWVSKEKLIEMNNDKLITERMQEFLKNLK